jgi:hypothetical protein
VNEISTNHPSVLRRFGVLLAILVLSSAAVLAQSAPPASGEVEKRVDSILSRMTLE